MAILDQKYVMQMVRAEDGARCDPFVSTMPALKDVFMPDDSADRFYLLVLMAVPDDDSDDTHLLTAASRFPMMKFSSFVRYVEGLENA